MLHTAVHLDLMLRDEASTSQVAIMQQQKGGSSWIV